jgi:hypothetical protein
MRAIIQGFHTSCLLCAVVNEPAARIQEELRTGYQIGTTEEMLAALLYFDDHNLFQNNINDFKKAISEHMEYMNRINQTIGNEKDKPAPFIHLKKRRINQGGNGAMEYGPATEEVNINGHTQNLTLQPYQYGQS